MHNEQVLLRLWLALGKEEDYILVKNKNLNPIEENSVSNSSRMKTLGSPNKNINILGGYSTFLAHLKTVKYHATSEG